MENEVRTMPGQIPEQKPSKPPFYKRGWFLFLAACIGSGLIAGLVVPLSYILTLAGFFGAVGCLVWLIVRAVRRREVRRPAFYLALCLAVWFGAGSQVPGVQSAIDEDAAQETRTEQEPTGETRPSLSDKVAEAKAESDAAPVKTGEAEEPVPDTVPEPEPDGEAYDSETIPQITDEEIKALFIASKANEVKPENLTVQVYPATGRCNVNYITRDTFWDETDFIRSQISAYINFCLDAYEVDGITDVFFMVSTEMTDTKGNKEDEVVMKIEMKKDAFGTYNWENMEYRPGMFEQFEADCSVLNIHAGILNNADTDKIYYVP